MNSIQFNDERGCFEYMGRYVDFSQDILRQFPSSGQDHTAICHRVSFSFMATALINALNFYLRNREEYPNEMRALAEFYVLGVILAVTGQHQEIMGQYPIGEENPVEANRRILSYMKFSDNETQEYRKLFGWMDHIMITFEGLEEALLLETIINRILDKLNNEKYNLKLGKALWNSSLQDAFDPFELVNLQEVQGVQIVRGTQIVQSIQSANVFIIGKEDSKVLTILKHATKPGGDDFTESALYIYTAQNDRSGEAPFIYQSCLEREFERVNMLWDCDIPILYHNYITGKLENFRTIGEVCQFQGYTNNAVW